jgi:hypothetical protein
VLQPTVSRPVCLGIKHPPGVSDQICITVTQLRVCWCGALSLTREDGSVLYNCCWPSPAQSFSGLTPVELATIFLLSQIRDFAFRRLLRLAGSRWRYSIPPPHGMLLRQRQIQTVTAIQTGFIIWKSFHYFSQWTSLDQVFSEFFISPPNSYSSCCSTFINYPSPEALQSWYSRRH